MKYDVRRCDKCGYTSRRGKLASGTAHLPTCHCGGKLEPVPLTQDDMTDAERDGAEAERNRCERILAKHIAVVSSHGGSAHALEDVLREIRRGEPVD